MSANKPLVLILCGGQALRLWPLSEYKSKNFVDVFEFSPLEVTIERFLNITPAHNIFLVANQKEKEQLYRVKGIKKNNIFFEPESKNTAAAIFLSLLQLQRYKQQPLIITPVDHLVKHEKQFFAAVRKALQVATQGSICTIGIKPQTPSPHFGYIQAGWPESFGVFLVKKFIEKPSINIAKKLISQGNCFYNSGMFVATIETLLNEYRRYYPAYEKFVKLFAPPLRAKLYKTLEPIPFDTAIMEKSDKVRLVKGAFFWKDFGSWHTLYELLPKDKSGNVKKAKTSIHKSENNLIYLDDPNKTVLILGLRDIFFIDTKDYTLLSTRKHIDELKHALSNIKK